MMDLLKISVDKMAGLEYKCCCGRTHSVNIKHISIGNGAVNKIPEIIGDFKGKKILLVADENTYNAAGKMVEGMIDDSFNVKRLIYKDKHLVADEKTLGRFLIEVDDDVALIITLGSGTLNDVSRFISSKTHVPYIIVCTAPSMDGYASVVSPLIVDGVKTTYGAVYPYAIVADVNIMKEAPMHMLQAGLGDIIGKYTAICDWKLSHILNGEHYCATIGSLIYNAVDKCVKAAPDLKDRKPDAIQAVTEGLILSGIAIGMEGTSRPASGEEHHISHCWEMVFLSEGRKGQYLHGNFVGAAEGMILEAYKYLSSIDIETVYRLGRYKTFDKDKWKQNLKDTYGKNGDNIIRFKEDLVVTDEKVREDNMENIKNKWGELKELFKSLPSSENIREIMKSSGATYNFEDIGIDRELFRRSIIAAKDIRRRYGVLQLLEDMGILDEAAAKITDILYN